MESIQPTNRKRLGSIYPIIFLGVLVYIGFRILDYNEASLAVGLSSASIRFQQGVLRYGTAIVPRDLLRGFDILCFDNAASRVRFVGWVVEVIDAKTLLWLARFFPPHPSFSLGWILTLILSPLFLFKLIRIQSRSREAAWIAIILFCLSAGSLSGITLRDSPLKPLVNFFTIYIFYLAARVAGTAESGTKQSGKPARLLGLILGALFISFFIDETAWFLYPAVPLLFPRLFFKPERGLFRWLYLGLFAVFLLTVTFLAPVLVEKYGSGGFDFWGYIITPDFTPDVTMWERWNMNNLLLSTKNLLVSQFIPWNQPWWGIAYLVILPYLVFNFFLLPPVRRRLVLRYILLLGAYLVFIVFYLGKGGDDELVLMSPFYYGALFSVLSIPPLAILLSRPVQGFRAAGKVSVVIFLSIVFMYNFPYINRMERDFFAGEMPRHQRLTPAEVVRAWRDWDNPEVRRDFIARFPHRWIWLFPLSEPESVRGRYLERSPRRPEVTLIQPTALSSWPSPPDSTPAVNLIDDDPETFWRAPLGEEPPWVKVNFQEIQGARIRNVAMLPRQDQMEEFPRRINFMGSIDGEVWTLVAPLLHPEGPPKAQGIRWSVDNAAPYRFYKLVFLEGHSDAEEQWVSLAELHLSE